MQDNFKTHIEQNMDEFEHSFDVDKGWSEFQERSEPKKKTWMWAAAASIVILLTIGGVNYFLQNGVIQPLSELEEVELFYQTQIDDMTQLVSNVTDDPFILADLAEMDRAFAEVKEDLKDDVANEEVIEAMMNHYRLKLEILEEMLDEIREDETDEEITIL